MLGMHIVHYKWLNIVNINLTYSYVFMKMMARKNNMMVMVIIKQMTILSISLQKREMSEETKLEVEIAYDEAHRALIPRLNGRQFQGIDFKHTHPFIVQFIILNNI
eukprot:UN07428